MKTMITAALLLVATLLPQQLHAQGMPYIRNYPATEYKAHNQNPTAPYT